MRGRGRKKEREKEGEKEREKEYSRKELDEATEGSDVSKEDFGVFLKTSKTSELNTKEVRDSLKRTFEEN